MVLKRMSRMFGLASMLAALCAGCSSSDAPPMTTVSGQVTLNGVPLETGSIVFAPIDGKGPVAGGKIKDGAYSFSSPYGSKRVEINAPRVIGQKKSYDTPDSPVVDVVEEAIPATDNTATTIIAEVTQEGTRKFDFDVKAAPKAVKK